MTEARKLEDMTAMLQTAFHEGSTPDRVEITLGELRQILNGEETEFLRSTSTVDKDAIIVLTKDGPTLLTDDNGNLLRFA